MPNNTNTYVSSQYPYSPYDTFLYICTSITLLSYFQLFLDDYKSHSKPLNPWLSTVDNTLYVDDEKFSTCFFELAKYMALYYLQKLSGYKKVFTIHVKGLRDMSDGYTILYCISANTYLRG